MKDNNFVKKWSVELNELRSSWKRTLIKCPWLTFKDVISVKGLERDPKEEVKEMQNGGKVRGVFIA